MGLQKQSPAGIWIVRDEDRPTVGMTAAPGLPLMAPSGLDLAVQAAFPPLGRGAPRWGLSVSGTWRRARQPEPNPVSLGAASGFRFWM